MDETAPVIERAGSQTYYNNRSSNRSDSLFGFFGSGFGGGFGSLIGDIHHRHHTINGYRVSWYTKARYMRRCATVNFLRLMFAGRLMANQFSVEHDEGVPEEIVELCRENVSCWWDEIVKHAAFGCMDFGWQGFEMVYRLENGYWTVDKVKPLLQDITGILEARRTGDFLGFHQGIDNLYADDGGVMLFNFIPEGTYHYGQPPLKAVECAFDRQCTLYNQIEQYDGRLASTHWAIYYPLGKTQIAGFDDPTVTFATHPENYKDNYDIALGVMDHLLTTGSVVIPSSIEESIQRLNEIGGNAKGPWRIEILSSGESGQSPYQERLKYYDTQMARALGFPERSVFEGEHGTKAESESQGEMSSVISSLYLQELCRGGNTYFLPDIIRTNFGDRWAKSVRIEPNAIQIDEQQFMRDLYKRVLDDPELLFIEHEKIDMAALRERIGIPVDEDVEEDERIEIREDGRNEPEENQDDVELSECGANAPGGGGFQKGNSCAGDRRSGSLDDDIKKKHDLKTLRIREDENYLELDMIRVKPEDQGQG